MTPKNYVPDLIFKEECFAILGACFAVYKDKGSGFLESVYQECLQIELDHQKIPHVAQPMLHLEYRGKLLAQKYQPDFVCYNKIILELKAAEQLDDAHRAQVLNYLKATNHQLGLLVNFGHYPKLQYERVIRTRSLRAKPEIDHEITL